VYVYSSTNTFRKARCSHTATLMRTNLNHASTRSPNPPWNSAHALGGPGRVYFFGPSSEIPPTPVTGTNDPSMSAPSPSSPNADCENRDRIWGTGHLTKTLITNIVPLRGTPQSNISWIICIGGRVLSLVCRRFLV
jgi:hypothetical protein